MRSSTIISLDVELAVGVLLLFLIVTGLQCCGKSCRFRWINYLSPDLKRGSFSH
ncbi:hypothetical protein BHM03_00008321 [Ensete ventricosum]|uniref:HTH myb-type domain-containing protein n=1 Tax=Ensete ventricosum TaxID=4639 RepID=A0A445MCF1_ENSVE|nr:hypothetical protein BHM03_00008321 [Ensete ventricosum]